MKEYHENDDFEDDEVLTSISNYSSDQSSNFPEKNQLEA